jgi:AraC family transcriptional regulator, transcriptional activator of pobA
LWRQSDIGKGEFDTHRSNLEKLLGRKPMKLKVLNTGKQDGGLALKTSSDAIQRTPADGLKKIPQPHKLDYYFFLFVDNGSVSCEVDMEKCSVSGGQLLLILPNQVYTPSQVRDDNCKYFKIKFDENTLALLPQQFHFLVNPLNKQIISFDDSSHQRVKVVFEILNLLINTRRNEQNTMMMTVYLNTLLAEFDNAYFKNDSFDNIANAKLSKFIKFKLVVESKLSEQHLIHNIAGEMALTDNSLYGIVKEFSGVSPKQYITNRLMLEAQRLLHYSKLSAKEVAYELGFSDPDYFSRLFKKSTGKSVSNYLEDLQDLSGR